MTRGVGRRSLRAMGQAMGLTALLALSAPGSWAAAPDPAAADQAKTDPAPAKKPAAKPAATKPAATSAAAKSKPGSAKTSTAKATPAKATPGKPPAKKAAAIAPASGTPKPAPARTERKIGEVVAVDDKDAGEIRLDGPWRDHGYPLRLWLTSYVDKQSGARRHQLSIQVTHHDEQARNYVRAARSDGGGDLALVQTQRPSLQCTKNRDGTKQCFHTEAYLLDMPDDMLAKARAGGVTLTLAADKAESFAVPVDGATVDAQFKAAEAVAPIAVAAKKP